MLFLRRPSSSLAHLPLTHILLSQGCHQVQADPKELLPEDAEPGLQGHPASMILGAPSLSPRLHCKEPLLPGRLWLPSQPYLAPSSLGLSFPKDTPGADASGPAGLGFLPREGRGSSGASSLQELYPPSTRSPPEPWPRSEMKGCWGRRREAAARMRMPCASLAGLWLELCGVRGTSVCAGNHLLDGRRRLDLD